MSDKILIRRMILEGNSSLQVNNEPISEGLAKAQVYMRNNENCYLKTLVVSQGGSTIFRVNNTPAKSAINDLCILVNEKYEPNFYKQLLNSIKIEFSKQKQLLREDFVYFEEAVKDWAKQTRENARKILLK